MQNNKLLIRKSLNKAFGKVKPDRESFEAFTTNLRRLLEQTETNKTESEEFHKNLISDFLKNTYYSPSYFINTRGRNDLVIHNGKDAQTPVGVILEVKRPTNKGEMLKIDNLNTKAFHELVLYFLRERFAGKNLGIRYLIATNIYEWFIFDAKIFEDLFAQDKALVKQFRDFTDNKLSGNSTDFFYKNIAEPAIAKVINEINFVHFDIRDYKAALESKKQYEQDLVDLFKVFSPQHLLKLDFANDSNSLNKPFYNELLYIIGLTEIKEGGKKLINRKKEGDRDGGSLLENAINRLDNLDRIPQLKNLNNPEEFGETHEEKLFNVALRLSINWINRVLFLKLLEAQLIKYHQGDRNFAFLNLAKVKDYQALASLFFEVLAREQGERDEDVREMFANVPYLNSSLFEQTEIEQNTITIGALKGRSLPIFSASVLKDHDGKRRSGNLDALAYLFEFLDAYDFSSDELTDGQEDSEKLINAAVLGLIFEKINGYKDGSFFTPSFITMYMCRETIRRAIVQKFNEVKGWDCENLDQLHDKISDKKEANAIINSLKICDPAVGSGHFLVSALNEIIAIKSELRVLLDRQGRSLRDYRVEVRHDKLIVYDDEGKTFDYRPKNAEKQRVQEALFHEKQTIIESCLFGVDINPNSVTICLLRLWIELLKNAYYKADGNLETLPNIDINIKCGNSLISRFPLDLKIVSEKSKTMIENYRQAVRGYHNAKDKGQKRAIERLIREIKDSFLTTLTGQDRNKTKLRNLEGELYQLENQVLLFEESVKEKKARAKKVTKLNNEIDKLRAEIEDIESGRLYENALEWRFEFPEVLNDDGDFVGFDIVIGNPPYLNFKMYSSEERQVFKRSYSEIFDGKADIYYFFFVQGMRLLKQSGTLSYISSRYWIEAEFAEKLRVYLSNNYLIHEMIDFKNLVIFDGVGIKTSIATFYKQQPHKGAMFYYRYIDSKRNKVVKVEDFSLTSIAIDSIKGKTKWILGESNELKIYEKIQTNTILLKDIAYCNQGIITGLDRAFITTTDEFQDIPQQYIKTWIKVGDIFRYSIHPVETRKLVYTNSIDDLSAYPLLEKRLIQYKEKLSKRREAESGKIRWFDLQWGRNPSLFNSKKLICRFKASQNTFSLDENEYYSSADTTIVTLKEKSLQEYDLKFILALLNSRLLDFYFKSYGKLMDYRFEYYPSPVEQLRIKKTEDQQIFIRLVDQILTAKKGDRHADTTKEEKTIDNLVYKLYQLTYDEVKIIDPEFELTEQEYTAIKME
ncbi:MAG: Eco57I restriction-modification methylase domain-containing protein [Cyanobacteria bacterium]|nr:Eco57I restriction-modification methylase domain-containing protein [Cyanobacteriota bacterium]